MSLTRIGIDYGKLLREAPEEKKHYFEVASAIAGSSRQKITALIGINEFLPVYLLEAAKKGEMKIVVHDLKFTDVVDGTPAELAARRPNGMALSEDDLRQCGKILFIWCRDHGLECYLELRQKTAHEDFYNIMARPAQPIAV